MTWKDFYQQIISSSDPGKTFLELLNQYGTSNNQFNILVNKLINSHGTSQAFRPLVDQWMNDQVMSGSTNPTDAYGMYDAIGMTPSAEIEKYLDNSVAQGNAQTERDYQEHMRDTSITSSANQLSSLGLSPSNVIQVGGASSGVSTNAAATNMHSAAGLKQQARINEYNQKMGLAKSIIGMTTALGAAGIYGHSLVSAKKAAAAMSSSTAHSALGVVRSFNGKGNPGYKTDENGLLVF